MIKADAAQSTNEKSEKSTPGAAKTNQASANFSALGMILLSVLVGAFGQLTVKSAMNTIGISDLSAQTLIKMATSPVLIVGLGLYGVASVLWLLALMKAELSFAYPFLSLTYIAVLVGGALLFKEHVTLLRFIGFGVIVAGLLIIARGEAKPTAESLGVKPDHD